MTINPDAKISSFDIDNFRFVVVDDVLTDPDAMRDHAIEVEKSMSKTEVGVGYELRLNPEQLGQRFPGFLPGLSGLVHGTIGANVKHYFGLGDEYNQLGISKGPLYNCVYKLPFFPPHVDPCQISSFIYLNLPDQCRGGTGVYRHIPSNRMNVVQDHVDLRWMTQEELMEPLSYSTGEWELLHKFEMKYNQLVIFNGSVIHKIFLEPGEEPFREDIENVRITMNNFFVYGKSK